MGRLVGILALALFFTAAGFVLGRTDIGAPVRELADRAQEAAVGEVARRGSLDMRTRVLLDEVAPGHRVRLQQFERLSALDAFEDGYFDLVFDDGEAELRLEFGLAAWRLLPVGGRLVLHDTRRPPRPQPMRTAPTGGRWRPWSRPRWPGCWIRTHGARRTCRRLRVARSRVS